MTTDPHVARLSAAPTPGPLVGLALVLVALGLGADRAISSRR